MTEFCAQEDILNLAKDLTKVDVLFNCAGYLIIISITIISQHQYQQQQHWIVMKDDFLLQQFLISVSIHY